LLPWGIVVAASASCAGSGADTGAKGGPVPPALPDLGLGDSGASTRTGRCSVPAGEENASPACTAKAAPPDAFKPLLKWSWTAPVRPGFPAGSSHIPLVGNFTDDNGDGKVDLCDVPDVIVLVGDKLFMLAGDTGRLEITFDGEVDPSVTPAFGDMDGDGLPDVVAMDPAGHLVLYDHRGKVKLVGPDVGAYKKTHRCHALAIYDLEGDGAPEVLVDFEVFDHRGRRSFGHDVSAFPIDGYCPANIAADLDGDGKLEVIFGNAAYRADGTLMWSIPGPPGQPQVANLDGDPEPEVLVARRDGILVLEHDGRIKFGPERPTGEAADMYCWAKPAAVHDFDGDGIADISASTCSRYGVYGVGSSGLRLTWTAPVDDTSGIASSTAFDFLGRGIAHAVYGDQGALWVFDGGNGAVSLHVPRASGTLIEYPVVADVDNDGSADVLVVSNADEAGRPQQYRHTLDVWQDEAKRWAPTRRIWNQHAYHVTNVLEDGRIPRAMPKNWLRLNTFRTNAQLEEGRACAPPPPHPPR
jgi:hypothetical protein